MTASRLCPDRQESVRLRRSRAADEIPVALRKALLADKSNHGNRFRKSLLIPGILPIVELRSSGNVPEHDDYRRYRGRNHFVRIFGKLKQ